uniref:WGS project CBMI000000000 data, contig CS3069_c002198 n=1 Tax=Fusarium clavum TaxID=2594811 RepID=A0A090MCP2_9HYPO|nr:unnamed protein product [Fusarium clavum]
MFVKTNFAWNPVLLTLVAGNPNSEELDGSDFSPDSRCSACYVHRREKDTEDPNPHNGKPFAKHQQWLDKRNDDIYICFMHQ